MQEVDVGMVIGIGYVAMNTLGFTMTDAKVTKLMLSGANGLMMVQALLLGSSATAIIVGFTALRMLIAAFTEMLGNKMRHIMFIVFTLGQTGLCVLFWKGEGDLLPLGIGLLATWIFLYLDNRRMRFASLVTCVLWFVNGVLIGSWALAVGQFLAVIALIYSIKRLARKEYKMLGGIKIKGSEA